MPATSASEIGELTVYNVNAFFELIAQELPPIGRIVTIDLRRMLFIDLFAMTALANYCGLLEESGYQVKLALGDGDASSFLERVGFFDLLRPEITMRSDVSLAHLAYAQAFRGANTGLLEFTRLDSNQAIRDVLSAFRRILRHRLRFSSNEAKTLAIMLSELCHNVLDHNRDPAVAMGVAAMQVHATGPRRYMQVVVADQGLGIRCTLSRHPRNADLTSDVEAIERSVELGVTEHEDSTHGNGLYHLLRLAREHRGAVHVRSGGGKVYYRADQAQGRRFNVMPLKGAQFALVFPTKAAPEIDNGRVLG
jgi:anti-sigma regulatory factor (Ser/Thr protein kinase)